MIHDVLIIGSGMYVLGKDDQDLGTILPTVIQEQEKGNIGKIRVVSSRVSSAKSGEKKLELINKKLGLQANVEFFPKENDNSQEYLEIAKKYENQVAIVCVPDHLHFEVTNNLLDLSIPTQVVKPFTTNLEEAKRLTQKAKEKKVWGGVEFHKRFDEANLLLKNNLNSGKIGDPLYFVIEYSQRKTIPLDVFKSWAAKTNIFQYLGVHYVDLIYFITEAKPLRVNASGQKNLLIKNEVDSFDSIQVNIEWELPNKKKFNSIFLTNWIDSNNSSSMSDQRIKVIGTNGRIESDQKNRGLQIVDDNSIEDVNPYFSKFFEIGGKTTFKGYGPKSISQFFQDVKNYNPNYKSQSASFEDAVVSTAIIEAVTKSLDEDFKWIDINL